MIEINPAAGIDVSLVWTWFLYFTRFCAILFVLPGIGTYAVPSTFKVALAITIPICVLLSGTQLQPPDSAIMGCMLIATEVLLGLALGLIPGFILASVMVAGQLTTTTMGLGAANLIDPSIGASVAILARLQNLFATIVFLALDGHHIIIKAATVTIADVGTNIMTADSGVAAMFLQRFSATFEVGVIVAAPVLVTILVSQFVLGLITKFIPQVNIFIISLPLTIGIGLYIVAFTFTDLANILIREMSFLEEFAGVVIQSFMF